MIGWALKVLAFWGMAAIAVYAIAGHHWLGQAPAPAAVASAETPAAPRPASASVPNSLVFRANKQGHVYLDAVVNGAPVRFVVDTGATVVALTAADATAAGLGRNDLDYRGRMSTANGVARAAPVKLREIRLGQFEAADVPAVVMDNLAVSLLGQSFLNRLESYEMRDGVLTLNWN